MSSYYDHKHLVPFHTKFAPNYSNEVADIIMSYLKDHQPSNKVSQDKFDMMVDVGCGSGQSTVMFAPYFKKILATDIGLNQINSGKQVNGHHENITFKVAEAEKIPVEDNSVDLIVSGSAAHWFKLPLFYKEVRRVLKPNGCLAIFKYSGIPQVMPINIDNLKPENQRSDLLCRELSQYQYSNELKMSEKHERCHKHWINNYEDIFADLPFANKERNTTVTLSYDWSMNEIIGALKSCHLFYDSNGVLDSDFMINLTYKLKRIWNIEDKDDKDIIAKVSFDVFILLSTNQ